MRATAEATIGAAAVFVRMIGGTIGGLMFGAVSQGVTDECLDSAEQQQKESKHSECGARKQLLS